MKKNLAILLAIVMIFSSCFMGIDGSTAYGETKQENAEMSNEAMHFEEEALKEELFEVESSTINHLNYNRGARVTYVTQTYSVVPHQRTSINSGFTGAGTPVNSSTDHSAHNFWGAKNSWNVQGAVENNDSKLNVNTNHAGVTKSSDSATTMSNNRSTYEVMIFNPRAYQGDIANQSFMLNEVYLASANSDGDVGGYRIFYSNSTDPSVATNPNHSSWVQLTTGSLISDWSLVRVYNSATPISYRFIKVEARARNKTFMELAAIKVFGSGYRVNYHGNGNTGGSAPTDNTGYTQGQTVTVLNQGSLVRTGHTFAGWNTAANGTGTSRQPSTTFNMGTANVNLYAQWTINQYTVNFHSTGGSAIAPITANFGTKIDAHTTAPIREGYTFAGWYKESSLQNKWNFAVDTIPAQNITLYAKWDGPITLTMVEQDNPGINAIINVPIKVNQIDKINAFDLHFGYDREKLKFTGWNGAGSVFGDSFNAVTNRSSVEYVEQGNAPVLGFSDNSVRLFSGMPEYGNPIGERILGSIQFEVLSNEKSDVDILLQNSHINTIVDERIARMAAIVEKGGVKFYKPKVRYNGNGNSTGAVPTGEISYEYGEEITVLGNTGNLAKIGHTFAGWNTAENGTGLDYTGGAKFTIGFEDVTLYAKWIKNFYDIQYHGNGNTGGTVPIAEKTSHEYESNVTIFGNTGELSRIGHTFAGWNTAADGSGTDYAGGSTLNMPAQNIILYAKWSPINYTITYNKNGDDVTGTTPTDNTQYNYLSTVTLLEHGNLAKPLYKFVGWNTSANGTGNDYMAGTTFLMPAESVILYAKWVPQDWKVIYHGNGNTDGSVPIDTGGYTIGTTVPVKTNENNLARTGYTFAGWNTMQNGQGTPYAADGNASFTMGTDDVNLYAQWEAEKYTVIYNGNDNREGEVPTDSNEYIYLQEVTVLGNPGELARIGHSFAGWNTKADGTGIDYVEGAKFNIGAGNVTLYAKWVKNNYRVNYHGNGNTSGNVPADNTLYPYQTLVTVLGNTGQMAKTGYLFGGWNTQPDGSGSPYEAAEQFYIGSENVTLYAIWITPKVKLKGTVYHPINLFEEGELAGATVTIQNKIGDVLATATTDADGYFETEEIDMVIAKHDISFSKAEYKTYVQEINVVDDTTELQINQTIVKWADVDGSGRINSADVATYWANKIRLTPYKYQEVADVNKDGNIDAADVVLVWGKITEGIAILSQGTQNVEVPEIKVSVDIMDYVSVDEIISIPIRVNEVGKIVAFNLDFDYERENLEFVGWDGTNSVFGSLFESITAKSTVEDVNVNGRNPILAFANRNVLTLEKDQSLGKPTGEGIIGNILFKVLIDEPVQVSLLPQTTFVTIVNNQTVKMKQTPFLLEAVPSIYGAEDTENISSERPLVLKLEANQYANWEVMIEDPQGNTIKNIEYSGEEIDKTWAPNPYSINNGEYKLIFTAQKGRERMYREEKFQVYNYPVKNNAINVEVQGKQGQIKASIENLGPRKQSPMLIVQLKDENGYVVYIGTAQMENMAVGQNITLSAGTILGAGQYKAEVFVWDGWDSKNPLSEKHETLFEVE